MGVLFESPCLSDGRQVPDRDVVGRLRLDNLGVMVFLIAVTCGWPIVSMAQPPQGGPKPNGKETETAESTAATTTEEQLQLDVMQRKGQFAEASELAHQIHNRLVGAVGSEHWRSTAAGVRAATLDKIARMPEAARAEMQQVREAEADIHQHLDARRAAEAGQLAAASLEIVRRHFDEQHLEVADALSLVGICRNRESKLIQAEATLRKTLAIYRNVLGDQHPGIGDHVNHLATTLSDLGRHRQAEPLYREALKLFLKSQGDGSEVVASAYNVLAGNLYAQSRFAEAGALIRKALAIRVALFGEDDLRTATCYNNLALNLGAEGKYSEAETFIRKSLQIRVRQHGEASLDTAESYHNLGMNLRRQSRFQDAAEMLEKGLEIRTAILGENRMPVASSLNSIALNLKSLGRMSEAEPLLRRALNIMQHLLGDGHPHVGTCVGNLASNLQDQGRYWEAHPLYLRAMKISLDAAGEKHVGTAIALNNIALNLRLMGRLSEAEPILSRALSTLRELVGDNHPYTLTGYNNLALIIGSQGRTAEEEDIRRFLLRVHREAGTNPLSLASGYDNLALNLHEQARYAEAVPLARQALVIFEDRLPPGHPAVGTACNNLGLILHANGEYEEAQKLLERAASIHPENHPTRAQTKLNLATNLWLMGRYSEAEKSARQAIDLASKALGSNHPRTGFAYHVLAGVLNAKGDYSGAQDTWKLSVACYEQARCRVSESGLGRASFAARRSPWPYLAAVTARLGDPVAAWAYLEKSRSQGLLDDLKVARLSPDQRDQLGRWTLDLRVSEDRLVALSVVAGSSDELKKTRARRDHLQQQIDELLSSGSDDAMGWSEDLKSIQAGLSEGAAFVTWLDLDVETTAADANGEHWGCVVRRQGPPRWVRLPGSGPEKQWTDADRELPGRVYDALTKRTWRDAPANEDLLRSLALQRIAPLRLHLGADGDSSPIKHLLVIPSEQMAAIPIEVLTDEYEISYAPSAAVFAHVGRPNSEEAENQPRAMLALGNPWFEEQTEVIATETPQPPEHGLLILRVVPGSNAHRGGIQSRDVLVAYESAPLRQIEDLRASLQKHAGTTTVALSVWRAGQRMQVTVGAGALGVQLDARPPRVAMELIQQADRLLMRSGSGTPSTLPGSEAEVLAIADLMKERGHPVTMLLSRQASEPRLNRLVRDRGLKRFQLLHFATHAVPDGRRPLHSALLLGAADRSVMVERMISAEPVFDGRLTAEEILKNWQLNADLVTLSACQSGLGAYRRGEGHLGFSQPLLLAGARSLVLSLWKVDDTATMLLMRRFYANLLGTSDGATRQRSSGMPMPKSKALIEAKRWLQRLNADEVRQAIATLELPARERGRVEKRLVATPVSAHPFAQPYYWSAFVLVGDIGPLRGSSPVVDSATADTAAKPDLPDASSGNHFTHLGILAAVVFAAFVAAGASLWYFRRLKCSQSS